VPDVISWSAAKRSINRFVCHYRKPIKMPGDVASKWALFASSTLPTSYDPNNNHLQRYLDPNLWHVPSLTNNSWSIIRCLEALPADASFSFELSVGDCGGAETKISLMGGVILRKSPTGTGPGGWDYCRWNGHGFVDTVPSRIVADTDTFHSITALVTTEGVRMYEDSRFVLELVDPCLASWPARVPELTVQHLEVGTALDITMRNTCVIVSGAGLKSASSPALRCPLAAADHVHSALRLGSCQSEPRCVQPVRRTCRLLLLTTCTRKMRTRVTRTRTRTGATRRSRNTGRIMTRTTTGMCTRRGASSA
jgi:hypothetical protein